MQLCNASLDIHGQRGVLNYYWGGNEVRWRRGKKQVWRPHLRTWGLSEANVLHWSTVLVTLLGLFGDPAVIWRPHSDSTPGQLCPSRRYAPDYCAQRRASTSHGTSSAARNFVREGAVIDVVLSLIVSSVYFLEVENWYKAPVRIFSSLFRGSMVLARIFPTHRTPSFNAKTSAKY